MTYPLIWMENAMHAKRQQNCFPKLCCLKIHGAVLGPCFKHIQSDKRPTWIHSLLFVSL